MDKRTQEALEQVVIVLEGLLERSIKQQGMIHQLEKRIVKLEIPDADK